MESKNQANYTIYSIIVCNIDALTGSHYFAQYKYKCCFNYSAFHISHTLFYSITADYCTEILMNDIFDWLNFLQCTLLLVCLLSLFNPHHMLLLFVKKYIYHQMYSFIPSLLQNYFLRVSFLCSI